jgi:hypothetical protein
MTHRLIPDGPDHLWCPDWKKPMSKVCKTCPLWMQVERTVTQPDGKQEKTVTWDCAKAQQAMLQLDIIAHQKQIIERLLGNQAATERMSNGIIARMDQPSVNPAQLDLIDAINGGPKLIGGH